MIATTRTAPASRRARAAAARVEPVVRTSSTSRALGGASPLAWISAGWPILSARRRRPGRPPPRRARQGRSGSPARMASAAAISPAGSNPRRTDRSPRGRDRDDLAAQQVARGEPEIRSAISPATGSRARNLSEGPGRGQPPRRGPPTMPDRPRGPGAAQRGHRSQSPRAEAQMTEPSRRSARRRRRGSDQSRSPSRPGFTAHPAGQRRAGGARGVRSSESILARRGPRCHRRASPRAGDLGALEQDRVADAGAVADPAAVSDDRRALDPRRPRPARPRPPPAPAPLTSAPSSGPADQTPSPTSGAPGSTATSPRSASRLPCRSSSRLPMSFQ